MKKRLMPESLSSKLVILLEYAGGNLILKKVIPNDGEMNFLKLLMSSVQFLGLPNYDLKGEEILGLFYSQEL